MQRRTDDYTQDAKPTIRKRQMHAARTGTAGNCCVVAYVSTSTYIVRFQRVFICLASPNVCLCVCEMWDCIVRMGDPWAYNASNGEFQMAAAA